MLAIGAIHAAALLALLLIDGNAARVLLLAVVVCSAGSSRIHFSAEHPRAVRRLSLDTAGEFRVSTLASAETAILEVASVVQPWLTVLVLRGHGGSRYRVIMLPDNVPGAPYRRLRARVRLDRRLIGGGRDVVPDDGP
jgi:hypothetical protein